MKSGKQQTPCLAGGIETVDKYTENDLTQI